MKTISMKLTAAVSGTFAALGLGILLVSQHDSGVRGSAAIRGASKVVGASTGSVTCGVFNFGDRFTGKKKGDPCDGCKNDNLAGVSQSKTILASGYNQAAVKCGDKYTGFIDVLPKTGEVICISTNQTNTPCAAPNIISKQSD